MHYPLHQSGEVLGGTWFPKLDWIILPCEAGCMLPSINPFNLILGQAKAQV